MAVRKCFYKDFLYRLSRSDRKLIFYGAGMLPYYIEPLIKEWGADRKLAFFVDGDVSKQGTTVHYADSIFEIKSPLSLANLDPDQYIILITAEKYLSILDYLDQSLGLNNLECHVYPLINHAFFKAQIREDILPEKESVIPKRIHYMWFGKGEKRELHKACIDSWRKMHPDFEIVEWNEENYDVCKNEYMRQAYERKMWAYVTDFARLDIIYHYGGVYFDTDVELVKPVTPLLSNDSFICFGEWPAPNSGAGIGCAKGSPVIKELMETRSEMQFVQKDGKTDACTNSNYEEQVLLKHGFQMDFSYQIKNGLAIYPPDIIAPVSIIGENAFRTERTIGIHHCDNSWRK